MTPPQFTANLGTFQIFQFSVFHSFSIFAEASETLKQPVFASRGLAPLGILAKAEMKTMAAATQWLCYNFLENMLHAMLQLSKCAPEGPHTLSLRMQS